MNFALKNHKKFYFNVLSYYFNKCKLQEPSKNHGILFSKIEQKNYL